MVLINEEIVGEYLDRYCITSNQHALKLGVVLVKYYKHLGMSNLEIKEKLKTKIKIKKDKEGFIKDYIYNMLVYNINVTGEFKNANIDIYKEELDIIESLETDDLKKYFLFSLSSVSLLIIF